MSHIYFMINSPTKKDAGKMIDSLLKKRLIAGASVIRSPARYWWKGKTEQHNYSK